MIYGAPEGVQPRLLAEWAKAGQRSVLYIARDDVRLAAAQQALSFFAPGLAQVALPAWDCLPYDRVSPRAEICARRMDALSRLAAHGGGALVVLTTVNAAVQRVPARAVLAGNSFQVAVGGKLDTGQLTAFLNRAGFNRVGAVMEPGEFAIRGGLIDLFPPGAAEPVRIDLFGDVVEGMRRFDPLSQRTSGKETELALAPASEILLDDPAIHRFRAGYRELFGAVTDEDGLYQSVSAGRKYIGMEHWLPLFHERLETIFDYLPGAIVALDSRADEGRDERLEAVADAYQARTTAQAATGEFEAPYKPLPPERLYLSLDEWNRVLAGLPVAHFNPFAGPADDKTAVDLGGRPGRDFGPDRAQGNNVYDALAAHIADLHLRGRRVAIAAYTNGSRERLERVLRQHGVAHLNSVADARALFALPPRAVGMTVWALEQGFETADLAVIGEQDLLGDRLARPRPARQAEKFIAELSQLSAGDLVVHAEHGIGRFTGLHTITVDEAPHDCLALLYDGGDKLYLPVENIEVLSRYGSADATVALDRLGGAAWQGRKARLKRRLKDMAEELIRVAALRALRPIEAMQPPAGLYEEFCARFPYEETADQAKAIAETIDDLAGEHPMDRLICGDVGFGKTEVALRVAFVVAVEGKQVAVICPTTLLCRQHHATFVERFHGLPVRIEQISRLVPPAKAAEVKAGLASGTVDIVIGTHALLAESIRFKRLGLVIVDEEQHFGVRHKERLKQLEADVHVLTLTATPIPRTLQLALSGVRDMSLIATPPVDRLAVRTFVMPFDSVMVREAMLREHNRGGQTFYVCPRIEDLPEAADFVHRHVPEVKAAVAHGRMAPRVLEAAMTDFYERRVDVLVSTDIIESGLDIPSANTLIVHRADMFGLSQLYQLRGRIGRSKLRAYAYLTVPPRKKLTASAEKRLRVLQALDTLGAGFSVASHDLDIRGAGNLLGEEQSGHVREVGFELYQELLNEAMATAKGEGALAADKWSPQISLGVAVLIPERYVADLDLRMQLYRRLARLEDKTEIDAFAAELIDRFGTLPAEVQGLLDVVMAKKLCRDAGVERVEAGPLGVTLAFRHNRFANPAGLVGFISRNAASAKLRPDHRLVLRRDWPTPDARLQGVMKLLEGLAEIARQPQPAAQLTAAPPSPSRAAKSKA
jgi:transcription-repair coupling factor (superfamily II helicase)